MVVPKKVENAVQKVQRLYAEIIRRLIEAGVEEGSFRPNHKPADIAFEFIGAALGLCLPMGADPQDMRPERRVACCSTSLSQNLGVAR